MRRSLHAITALALTTQVATAQTSAPAAYRFAGLEWRSAAGTVKDVLASKGYQFRSQDSDGDLRFDGTYEHRPAVIYAFMDGGGHLVKVDVAIPTPDEEARATYEVVGKHLRAQYGAPDLSNAYVEPPHVAGDGSEDQAIREGKGHYSMCWMHGHAKYEDGLDALCLTVTKRLAVQLSYESTDWHTDFQRRQAKD